MKLRQLISATLIIGAANAWGLTITATPGALAGLVGDNPDKVSQLTVTGSINAADLQFIADKMRSLETLDLSNARIEAYDGDMLANGMGTAPANELAKYSLAGTTAKTIALPRTITAIDDGALSGSGITSITIPASVKAIGMGAFAGCKWLTSLTIPATVTKLGAYMCKDLPALTKVVIKAETNAIPAAAFAECTKLASVELPSSIALIDSAAFAGCSALADIKLPQSLTHIGNSAFRNTALTSVDLTATKASTIGDWAYADNTVLAQVLLPKSLKTIGQGAFFGNTSLSTIALPGGVTEIPAYAFTNNTSMAAQSLGNSGIVSIGNLALKGWASTKFELPSSLDNMGDYAMEGWNKVTELYAMMLETPTLGNNVWQGVDQPNVKLYVPDEVADAYKAAEQWNQFDVIGTTGVEDVLADNEISVNGYFDSTNLCVEASTDINLVEVYTPAGAKLAAVTPYEMSATIDTEGWNTRIYITRVVLADGSTTTLKLARR